MFYASIYLEPNLLPAVVAIVVPWHNGDIFAP